MRTLASLALGAVLATTGCTTPSGGITASGPAASDVIAVDRDFDLKPGRTARVDGTAITVSFVGVPEDSRCPTDVQCVWAGNGAVRSEEHTSELQSRLHLVCRLLLEKKK